MKDRSVIEIMVNLYKMAIAENIVKSKTGDLITFEDYQYMLSEEISELVGLISLGLEEEETK